mmetsp:Transcript_16140/g.37060  ORF Transcript_16140/g.37060 Transcript_16140/m.37060 type:complete len:204 (-) Transcript_16140:178-789(-)
MGELHSITVSVNEVVIDALVGLEGVALLVTEHTDLDLSTGASAHGSGVESLLAIILGVVDHLALQEFGCINIAVLLHVLDFRTFLCTRIAINGKTTPVIVVVVVPTLVTSVTHFLLELLLIFDSGLKIFLKVDEVFSVVDIAGRARASGAKTENDKTLGGKHSWHLFVLGKFIIVGLDELALLVLHGVSGDINLVVISVIKAT